MADSSYKEADLFLSGWPHKVPIEVGSGRSKLYRAQQPVKSKIAYKKMEAMHEIEKSVTDRELAKEARDQAIKLFPGENKEQRLKAAKYFYKEAKSRRDKLLRFTPPILKTAREHGADKLTEEIFAKPGERAPVKMQPARGVDPFVSRSPQKPDLRTSALGIPAKAAAETGKPIMESFEKAGKQAASAVLTTLDTLGRGGQGMKYGEMQAYKGKGYAPIEWEELKDMLQSYDEAKKNPYAGMTDVMKTGLRPYAKKVRYGGLDVDKRNLGMVLKSAGSALKHGKKAAFDEAIGGETQLNHILKDLGRFYAKEALRHARQRKPGASKEEIRKEAKYLYKAIISADEMTRSLKHPQLAQFGYEVLSDFALWPGVRAGLSAVSRVAGRAGAPLGKAIAKGSPEFAEKLATKIDNIEGAGQGVKTFFTRDKPLIGLGKYGKAGEDVKALGGASADVGEVAKEMAEEQLKPLIHFAKKVPKKERAKFMQVAEGKAGPEILSKKSQKFLGKFKASRENWAEDAKQYLQRIEQGQIKEADMIEDYVHHGVVTKDVRKHNEMAKQYGFDDLREMAEGLAGDPYVIEKVGGAKAFREALKETIPEELQHAAKLSFPEVSQRHGSGWARVKGTTGVEKTRTGAKLPIEQDASVQFEQLKKTLPGAIGRTEQVKTMAEGLEDLGMMKILPESGLKPAEKRLDDLTKKYKRTERVLNKTQSERNKLMDQIKPLQRELGSMPGMKPGTKRAFIADFKNKAEIDSLRDDIAKLVEQAKTVKKPKKQERIAKDLQTLTERLNKATAKSNQLSLRAKEISWIAKRKPELAAKLRFLYKQEKKLNRQLAGISGRSADETLQISKAKQAIKESEARRVEYGKIQRDLQKKHGGMEFVKMNDVAYREWKRAVAKPGDRFVKEHMLIPKPLAEQLDMLYPRKGIKQAADEINKRERKLYKMLGSIEKEILRPFMTSWRQSKTFLGGGERYLMMNLMGNPMLSGVGLGMKVLDPTVHSSGAKMLLSGLVKKDPATLGSKFVLRGGQEVKLGEIYKIFKKYGILGQGKKRYMSDLDFGSAINPLAGISRGVHFMATPARKVAEFSDDMMRVTAALGTLKSTSPKDVAHMVEMVSKLAGNHRRMTMFERNVMRNILPFYTWNKFIYPFWVKHFIQHPERLALYEHARQAGERIFGEKNLVSHLGVSDFIQLRGMTGPEFMQPTKEQREQLGMSKSAYTAFAPETPNAIVGDLATMKEGFMRNSGPLIYPLVRLYLGYDPETKKRVPENETFLPDFKQVWESAKAGPVELRDELKRSKTGQAMYSMVDMPSDRLIDYVQLLWNDGQYSSAGEIAKRYAIGRFAGLSEMAIVGALKKMGFDVERQGISVGPSYHQEPEDIFPRRQKVGTDAMKSLKQSFSPR